MSTQKGQKTQATPAAKAPARNRAATPRPPAPKYVTEERFTQLEEGVGKILDRMEDLLKKPADAKVIEESPIEKEVTKAGPTYAPINPAWEEKAKEIIGEAVDHCDVVYLKNGGVVFTIVIKEKFSNAGKDYLERMGSDRRSKEVGSEGIEGVENWCKLVKSNLARPSRY